MQMNGEARIQIANNPAKVKLGAMPSLSDTEKIKAEIALLDSALKDSTDSLIQKVIQTRIEELRRKLAQLQSSGRGPE